MIHFFNTGSCRPPKGGGVAGKTFIMAQGRLSMLAWKGGSWGQTYHWGIAGKLIITEMGGRFYLRQP